ncbi:GTP--adenosylcobinamide-phosphate guanylyltransferase [Croceicoccus ponticola]|uniref:GTP--adenosylcobinamide-phosphate guanylyltransferase n=1 Tax=Croceicoccus ponticola TaxID=2217664 RepID=A0A437H089_9SPHN|nr:nucleotidyltransferase family protein [Croceicoccus ponticola]RVQ69026.1 GTP--adenosylcobinamide-phosphate guanylyltransferase [Croceicoccus ponticola]
MEQTDLSAMTALVLAGVRPSGDPFAERQGVIHKGLIVVAGKPILTRVCDALHDAGVGRVVVATNCDDVAALARANGADVTPAQSGPSATVGAALVAFGAPLLVTTADHALLQGAWVRDFVADAAGEGDVSILLASRDVVERDVPGTQRTWMRLADGHWTGCNLFLLRTEAAGRGIAMWSEVEANRKRPFRMASRLGWGTLVRFVLGRLSIKAMVARIGRQAGIDARIVAARDGRVAVDVDKEADLDLVRRLMQSEGRA